MPKTIMSPEEVMKYGKRLILFPKGKSKVKQIFYIEHGKIFQKKEWFVENQKCVIKTNPVEIMDIYDRIEFVYGQQKKGILLARRSGGRNMLRGQCLPLKKTGKGMGQSLTKKQVAIKIYAQQEAEELNNFVKANR